MASQRSQKNQTTANNSTEPAPKCAAPLVVFTYQSHGVSHDIRGSAEKMNLTDMWRAGGSDSSKRPAKWMETDAAKGFIAAVSETVRPADSLIDTHEGRNGGTWAHWQIAMAYAKYLDHAFHMWCNEVVRAHMAARDTRPAGYATNAATLIAIAQIVGQLAERVTSALDRFDERLSAVEERGSRATASVDTDGTIGAETARRRIRRPIREIAVLRCGARRGPELRASISATYHELRGRLDVPQSLSFDALPIELLGRATGALTAMRRQAVTVDSARAAERQQPLFN